MKQHISPEQLEELSEKGNKKLRKWWKPKESDLYSACLEGVVCEICDEVYGIEKAEYKKCDPLLSIGQMIEFLELYQVHEALIDQNKMIIPKDELCDELWKAVKEVLEE